MALALGVFPQLMWRQLGVVAFVGSQDETPLVVDAGLSGRERRGQSPGDVVAHLGRGSAVSGASSCAIAWRRVHGTAVEEGRLHALREDRQRLPRIGFAREGRATYFLAGVACLLTVLAPLLVLGALRRRLARLGVDAHPAWRDSPVGRGQALRAIRRQQGGQGVRLSLGQDRWGVAQGRRDPGAQLRTRRGALLEVLGTLEGFVAIFI